MFIKNKSIITSKTRQKDSGFWEYDMLNDKWMPPQGDFQAKSWKKRGKNLF